MVHPTELKITDHQVTTPDNVVIKLEPTDGSRFEYLAGQFLSFSFQINGREVRRSYSLCSSPVLDEAPTIAVKLVENGEITKFLHHKVGVGDVLQALRPNGLFVYEPEADSRRTIFLFAAGIGITPIFSILKTALTAETQSKLVLVYSNKNMANTLFFDEINEWQQRFPDRLEVIFIYSESKNLMKARLNNVWIENLVNEHLQFEKEDALFYTCGPINYMVLCRITLLSMGFAQDQIKRETYFIPEDEADDDDMTEKVVDTNTYLVTLDYLDRRYELTVPYNKRILEVALEQKINLPYSCAAGMCSSCASTCVAGGIRMEYNEVLTDEEVKNGRVLICTAHPTADHTHIVVG